MAENQQQQQQQQVLPFWNSRCPTSGGALHRKWKLLARACFLEDRSLYCWTAGTVAAFAARLAAAAAASDAVGYRQFADALRAATNERSAEISAQRRIPLRQVRKAMAEAKRYGGIPTGPALFGFLAHAHDAEEEVPVADLVLLTHRMLLHYESRVHLSRLDGGKGYLTRAELREYLAEIAGLTPPAADPWDSPPGELSEDAYVAGVCAVFHVFFDSSRRNHVATESLLQSTLLLDMVTVRLSRRQAAERKQLDPGRTCHRKQSHDSAGSSREADSVLDAVGSLVGVDYQKQVRDEFSKICSFSRGDCGRSEVSAAQVYEGLPHLSRNFVSRVLDGYPGGCMGYGDFCEFFILSKAPGSDEALPLCWRVLDVAGAGRVTVSDLLDFLRGNQWDLPEPALNSIAFEAFDTVAHAGENSDKGFFTVADLKKVGDTLRMSVFGLIFSRDPPTIEDEEPPSPPDFCLVEDP